MKNFDKIIAEYKSKGVSSENIDYAIECVKNGNNRGHIIENLMEDYRGLDYQTAAALVDDLYKESGNEFTKQNRSAIFLGLFLLLIGVACSIPIYKYFFTKEVTVLPTIVLMGAGAGLILGSISLFVGLAGKAVSDPMSELGKE